MNFDPPSDPRQPQVNPEQQDNLVLTVLEHAPEPVIILCGSRLRYVNAVGRRELGYERPEEALDKDLSDFLDPAQFTEAAHRLQRVIETQRPSETPHRYLLKTPRGDQRDFKAYSVPIQYENRPCVLTYMQDVTEASLLRAHLLQADRLATLGTLATGIAHEINNPLAYLLLNLEYLERHLDKVGDAPDKLDSMKRRLAEMRHGGERVTSIVRDLRSLARTADGTVGPVDVVETLEGALKICQHQIRQRARLVRDYGRVPPIVANAARLEQVFLNLLTNACHALPERTLKHNNIRITVRESEGNHIEVSVSDTGVGIGEDNLQRIFDPFFTTKPTHEGTGLGLPICKRIVEQGGGRIAVQSAPNQGTTVTVQLPLAPAATQLPAVSTPPSFRTQLSASGRILIIDDEVPLADSLRLHLRDQYDVVTATGGATALRLLATDSAFDCILCDIMMPDVTGMDVYETLLREHPRLALRSIFMTGGAYTERAAKFVADCPRPLMKKPFSISQIRTALFKVVGTGKPNSPERRSVR